jgi:hypothetical protein
MIRSKQERAERKDREDKVVARRAAQEVAQKERLDRS